MIIKETDEPNIHGKMLAGFINELLIEGNLKVASLDAIAVSEGPGSYTGLRIGVSLAKALCYASGVPLIAVDTLESLALAIQLEITKDFLDGILLPMIDARRMEVYLAGFDPDLNKTLTTRPVIIDPIFSDLLELDTTYYIGGSGSEKVDVSLFERTIIKVNNINFSSNYIGILAWQKFLNNQFEDVAYFEPVYLKEFAVTLKG